MLKKKRQWMVGWMFKLLVQQSVKLGAVTPGGKARLLQLDLMCFSKLTFHLSLSTLQLADLLALDSALM